MTPLAQALEEYLRLRRALGFRLRLPAQALRQFVAFVHAEGAGRISAALALRWATQPTNVQPATWARRLGMVRQFARWYSATDPHTEIPSPDLLPHRYRRTSPHLYDDAALSRLLHRAQQLPSSSGLRAATYTTLFGLLVATGLRVNEALGLDRRDVDLDQGVLFIRRTKFGKSRYVPLHPSTTEALRTYRDLREQLGPASRTPAFFISERGSRISEWMARYTFAKLSQHVGLRSSAKGHGRGPRLHDLRHRFAVRTVMHWYRAGVEVERALPKLATYLGHVHMNETYWYLEAVPELLQLATARLLGEEVSP